jgi:hypothetical protein
VLNRADARARRLDPPAGAPHTVLAEAPVVTLLAFATSAAAAGLDQLPVPTEVV